MRAVELEAHLLRLGLHVLRLFGKQGQLRSLRPHRDGGEGEQIDPELLELREDLGRRARLVRHLRVEVLDPADPDRHDLYAPPDRGAPASSAPRLRGAA